MHFLFIQQTDLRTLTFFLPGWGMDVRPFRDYRSTETDILMAYDFSDLELDAKWFSGYERIRIVAWSMGVWAASVLMARHPWLGDEAIAVNGTPFPIDDERGIPPKIFNATLAGLSEDSLARFDRRMCADRACFNAYNRCHPERGLADLSHELACIGREVPLQPVDPRFTTAYAGDRDMIFPFRNQVRAWSGRCELQSVAAGHYAPELLRTLVCEEGGCG